MRRAFSWDDLPLAVAVLVALSLAAGHVAARRLPRSPGPPAATTATWWFACGSCVPGGCGRHWATNHAGIIYYTGALGSSISMNAVDCTIPTDLLPMGK